MRCDAVQAHPKPPNLVQDILPLVTRWKISGCVKQFRDDLLKFLHASSTQFSHTGRKGKPIHLHARRGKAGAGASLLLSVILALLFVATARDGLLRSLAYYWLTIVAVRAAGTAVGDLLAGRNMLGLPTSTLVTGMLFVALLAVWKEPLALRLAPAGS